MPVDAREIDLPPWMTGRDADRQRGGEAQPDHGFHEFAGGELAIMSMGGVRERSGISGM